ncbi:hypothetical protein ACFL5K_01055 [Gemmatimonadota bacterium]
MQQSEDDVTVSVAGVTVSFGKTDVGGSIDAGGGTMLLAATVSVE